MGGSKRGGFEDGPGASLAPHELVVLYEDNHLLAVFKPAGVLVQTDRTGDPSLQETAKAWLKERYAKPGNVFLGIVHRLDRPTPGVVLFARTSKAAGRLSAQFRERAVEKVYEAVVRGTPHPARGRLVNRLAKDPGTGSVRVLPPDSRQGQEARLEYTVVASEGERSLVSVRLETGRSHQIRVQLAAAGHPIVGDRRYGGPAGPRPDAVALLARRLTVAHPIKGDPVVIEAATPEWWPWSEHG